jgi:hypothetical protein
MSQYNATVTRFDPDTGEAIGCFVAEGDEAGRMLRSNWIQFTGLEGTPAYDEYLRRQGAEFRIVRDGGEGSLPAVVPPGARPPRPERPERPAAGLAGPRPPRR